MIGRLWPEMRILLATDHFPPFIGGAHRQAQLIARAMAERGHEVAVATPWHGGLPRVEERRRRTACTGCGSCARRSRPWSATERQRHQPPFPDPVTVAGLRKLIAEFEPELIHAYGWLAFSVAVALGPQADPDAGLGPRLRLLLRHPDPAAQGRALRRARRRSSAWPAPASTTAGPRAGSPPPASPLSKPLLERKMTGLHSVSTYVHDVTAQHIKAPASTDLVEVTIPSFQAEPPPQPGEEAPDIDAWLAKLPDEPFILFVGAFRKVKGLETLFDAYRRLDSPPPLVLMGTYERDSPPDFPPEAIVLTDVPHQVVMASWDKAMFGVMPSLWPEPLGATVAEGMSRGRPVIGTRLGGHTDMLNEDDRRARAAGRRRGAARGDGGADRRSRAARGDGQGRRRARPRFRAESVLPRFEDAYRSVIAAGNGHRRMKILLVAPMPPQAAGVGAIPMLLDAQLSRPAREHTRSPLSAPSAKSPGEAEAAEQLLDSGLDAHFADRRRRALGRCAAGGCGAELASRWSASRGPGGRSGSPTGHPADARPARRRPTASTSPWSRTARCRCCASRPASPRC